MYGLHRLKFSMSHVLSHAFESTFMKNAFGVPSASSISNRPALAQKLTPWHSVDITRLPSGSSCFVVSIRVCAGCRSQPTSENTWVNLIAALPNFQTSSTVVVHWWQASSLCSGMVDGARFCKSDRRGAWWGTRRPLTAKI